MHKKDIETWNRREVYEFFSAGGNPYYMLTVNTDVTDAYLFSHRAGISFYSTMIWLIGQAVNSVENFRYRISDGELMVVDRRQPSFTSMQPGEETFKFLRVDLTDDPVRYAALVKEKAASQKTFIDRTDEEGDLIFMSCVPWIETTALGGMRERDASGRYDDMTPRITWGRYFERDGRKYMGISFEVNHRAVDGFHIAEAVKEFERLSAQINNTLTS